MACAPKVLVSWEINPGYTPPMRFSPHQVTACRRVPVVMPFFGPEFTRVDIWTPQGSYDLFEEVRRQTGDTRFDLVVVWSSCARSYQGLYNVPFNTRAFGCPTLLIAGDTHHMIDPISEMLRYWRQEQFDYVMSVYDRQHLHWFGAAGVPRVGWFPLASVVDVEAPVVTQKVSAVCFFGHTSSHPMRARILASLQQSRIPLVTGALGRVPAAREYARNLISLNCSLNGDFNLRTHEVLAAGGFLLTDRLSPYSGFQYVLQSGRDCDTFASMGELYDKIRFYRSHPETALRIARAGHDRFRRELHPDIRIRQIIDWITEGSLSGYNDVTAEPRYQISKAYAALLPERVKLYESLQELHRKSETVSVLLTLGAHPVHALDIVDLPRLKLFARADDLTLREHAQAWRISDAIEWVSPERATRQHWDYVITDGVDLGARSSAA